MQIILCYNGHEYLALDAEFLDNKYTFSKYTVLNDNAEFPYVRQFNKAKISPKMLDFEYRVYEVE